MSTRAWAAAAALAIAIAGCSATGRFELTRAYETPGAEIRLRVETTRINVAQTVLVVLEAVVDADTTPELPESFTATREVSLTIQDTGAGKTEGAGRGRTRYTRWYRLEPYLSGDYVVAPLAVTIVDAAGKRSTVKTDPVPVQVTSLLPEDFQRLDIRDIAGNLRPPWRPPPGLVAVVSILFAAALATGAWLWLQKRARDRYVPPPRPAHELAYEEIEALVARRLVESGEVKLFYQEVTAILRRYIERRFGLRAPERTTEEFLGELRETEVLSDELKKLLRLFLQHADLVKFAQLRPQGNEIESTLSSARDFIRATQIVPSEGADAV